MVSYEEALREIGERARQLRFLLNLKQAELAEKAGVSEGTIKRFEHTGSASIENVLRIATALGAASGFEKLFEAPKYRSIDDALSRDQAKTRQRVRTPK
jgi:transcriptional regulator with XRE-family HTH domain